MTPDLIEVSRTADGSAPTADIPPTPQRSPVHREKSPPRLMQEQGSGLIMMVLLLGAMGALAAGGYSASKFAIEGPGGYLLL